MCLPFVAAAGAEEAAPVEIRFASTYDSTGEIPVGEPEAESSVDAIEPPQGRRFLQFDGQGTAVTTSLPANNLPESFTIEAWVKVADWRGAGRQMIVSGWSDAQGDERWAIGIDRGQFAYFEGGQPLHTTGPRDGEWTHFAVKVAERGDVVLFVNGMQTRRVSSNRRLSPNDSVLTLGARQTANGWTDHLHGSLANVRIWPKLLSQSEIQDSMGASVSPGQTGWVAAWQMDEGSGDNLRDLSGNGFDGAVLGGEWTDTLPAPALSTEQPVGLLLNWQGDPSTTMTIDWHTQPNHETNASVSFALKDTDDWQTVNAETFPFPFSQRKVHRAELTGLDPGSTYRFRVGGFSRVYSFDTLPESLEGGSLTVAIGGDLLHRAGVRGSAGINRRVWFSDMNRVVMAENPAFAVVGGDLAYADGQPDQAWRWYLLFAEALDTLVSAEGRVLPLMMGIGNHEVRQGYYYNWSGYEPTDEKRAEFGPFFFQLLPWPGQPGYATIDVGDFLSIISLDSDHANPVEGAQTEWLAAKLADRQGVPHVWPIYHESAYTSARNFDRRTLTAIREHWIPVFQEHAGIRVVFENHDHTYKRTPPLRSSSSDTQIVSVDDGITFMGDGAWGVGLRNPHNPDNVWYLERAERKHHVIIAEITSDKATFRSIDSSGTVFDRFEYNVP